ncbi:MULTISPECIES: hypothetical protein [unclassified Pseudoalteromonas]|uniref:hypothetical protein n=1 Tax=unclassified Pseudoalteromonas TaxID=194690 RepID=UPI001386B230|nr:MULTISPECIES: hypothetical protein [unclassified Pseudoalteromonas]
MLTHKVYKVILESEGVEKIAVQYNVTIEGKFGVEHQINAFSSQLFAKLSG